MEYEEFVKQREENGKFHFKIAQKIKPFHIILFGILLLIGTMMTKNGQGSWVYYIVGGLIAFFIFVLWKQDSGVKQIPRHIAQEMARQDLINEVKVGRVFVNGTEINPTGYFKDQAWDSGDGAKLFKYNIGFQIKEPNCGKREIIYQMDPFKGNCKGIIEAPVGFYGQDVKDIQQIFPERFVKEENKKE
jgi:hypothetical protein